MSILDLEFNEYYNYCKHCDKYFEANRSDKKYCSSNCRHKAKYRRNKKAKEDQEAEEKQAKEAEELLSKEMDELIEWASIHLDEIESKPKKKKSKLKKTKKQKVTFKSKLDYARLTFLLSVVGFIGSIGFYIGVLRQVYSTPDNLETTVSELSIENEKLKSEVYELTQIIEVQ